MLRKICPICANGYNYNINFCRNCGCKGLSDVIDVGTRYRKEETGLRRLFIFKTDAIYPSERRNPTRQTNLPRRFLQKIQKLFIKRA